MTERFENTAKLKKKMSKVWKKSFDLPVLRKAISEFCPQLEAVVKENCGPIKVNFE